MTKNKLQKLSSLGVASVLLGSVLAPVGASALAESDTSTVQVTVNSVISISSADTVAFSITPDENGAVSSDFDTVNVNTNNDTGYTLGLEMNSGDPVLSSLTTVTEFLAHDGTIESPSPLEKNTWGFALASDAGGEIENGFAFTKTGETAYTAESSNLASTSDWAGVPEAGQPVTIKETTGPQQNSSTVVWYGANADTTQDQGVYTGVVKYTATVKL